MLLMKLTCCCFLVLFVESRSIANNPLPWLQLHDEGDTVYKIGKQNAIWISGNMGFGLVAVERLNQNDILGCISKEQAEEGKEEEGAAVEKSIKESMDVKVRFKEDVEVETEANAQLMRKTGTPAKLKGQSSVGKETISGTNKNCKYEVRKTATDKKTEVQEIAWPKLKATLDGVTKDEDRVKIRSELSPKVETVVRFILKSESKAKELQQKAQPIVVQVLETRGFPESISKPFRHRTSGLMTPGDVLDLGKRTIQPYIEWMKTFCRNLPINNNFLVSSFHRLLSLGGGRGGKVGRDARKPKSKRSKIQPVDLGFNRLADGKQIEILPGKDEDGLSLPVTYENVEIFRTPPQSPMKIFRDTPPTIPLRTSPRISPEPFPKFSPDSIPVRKRSPKEFKGRNGKEKKPADFWAIEDIGAPITPPHSPQISPEGSPPRYTKKSPPKKSKGGNGSGVPGGESNGVFGARKDAREPKTPPESPGESPKKSPVNERWDVDGYGVGGHVPRSRFAGFNPKRLQEVTLSFKTRRKEMGVSSEDDEEDRQPKRAVSSDFIKNQVFLPDAWKKLEEEYGKQKA